jgi:hypothetical protein
MTQPNIEDYFGSMDNLDITLSSHSIQPSSPSDETSLPIRYDQNTSECYYELDLADVNMTFYSEQDFRNVIGDFGLEQFAAPSPIIDDISELLNEGTEELHSTESNDMAGCKLSVY